VEVALRDYAAASALTTDLVLTVAGRTVADRLTSPAQLAELLSAHGLDTGPIGVADLEQARDLRAEIVALFGHRTDEDVVDAASAMLARCPHRLRAGPQHAVARHGDWRLVPTGAASPIDQVRLVVAAGLLAVVHALGADRLRTCAAPGCSGRFVDASNTGRRTYCLPRVCGNRVNVARYRARRGKDPGAG
jgi:predicted RNA-binding Zn ribbon-like protein